MAATHSRTSWRKRIAVSARLRQWDRADGIGAAAGQLRADRSTTARRRRSPAPSLRHSHGYPKPDFRCLRCKRSNSWAPARTRYLKRCLRRTGSDVAHVTCVYPLLAAALSVSCLTRTVRRRHVTAAEPLATGIFRRRLEITTATPQHFTVASRRISIRPPGSSRPVNQGTGARRSRSLSDQI